MFIHQKPDLTSLKSEADKTDVDKLKTVPIVVSQLNIVVNNDTIKNTAYDELVKNVNTIYSKQENKKTPDTSKFILSQYFNILRKINFNARMAEALKRLATKKQVENALDLGNKNAEKNLKTSKI